jgi:ATP-binding cassette subfamily B (MDR/TAP) protein 1
MEVIKRVPKIDSDSMEGEILEHVSGNVEFKHVEFAYPSRPESIIFKDFCLEIPAGKAVALVGGSGSGKSTVISLLQRFYDPLGGEILIDGVAIDKLQLKWVRSQMGLVSQEPALFATTIKALHKHQILNQEGPRQKNTRSLWVVILWVLCLVLLILFFVFYFLNL